MDRVTLTNDNQLSSTARPGLPQELVRGSAAVAASIAVLCACYQEAAIREDLETRASQLGKVSCPGDHGWGDTLRWQAVQASACVEDAHSVFWLELKDRADD